MPRVGRHGLSQQEQGKSSCSPGTETLHCGVMYKQNTTAAGNSVFTHEGTSLQAGNSQGFPESLPHSSVPFS